jgi:hypothetical protein
LNKKQTAEFGDEE